MKKLIPLFKLSNVILSPAIEGLLAFKPQKYISIVVKHQTGNFGKVSEKKVFENNNVIFNQKGTVLSVHTIDGVQIALSTDIGSETVITTLMEIEAMGGNVK